MSPRRTPVQWVPSSHEDQVLVLQTRTEDCITSSLFSNITPIDSLLALVRLAYLPAPTRDNHVLYPPTLQLLLGIATPLSESP